MAALALVLYGLWALLAVLGRVLLQLRRTGDSGFRGMGRASGSIERLAGLLFVGGVALGALGPIAELAGWIDPVGVLDRSIIGIAGAAVAGLGILGTLAAQLAMGDSWRLGVDQEERTELVTDGPFRLVRNPIFSTMLLTALGLTCMVPNVLALAGFVALTVGLELHVRLVEEPYLLTVHGEAYRRYTARVGRFLPSVGRAEPVA